jgi:hypothetical protein
VRSARSDGRMFLLLGIGVFLLFGLLLRYSATDSMLDFQQVYCGAQLFLHHQDPYNPALMKDNYRTQLGETDVIEHHNSMVFSVYLPMALVILAPIAKLPWAMATALWDVLIFGSLVAAASLMWRMSAEYAPILSGVLIGFAMANCAVVFANGNPAGLVVGLCVIAAWCFYRERLVWLGVVCLVVGLAIKPQDAGLIWLFFLLRSGTFRKRALQTAAAMALLIVVSVAWTWHIAPHWVPEIRSNIAQWSGPGGNCDPGPTGLTTRSGTMEVITDLQSVISLFRDSPPFYNAITFLFCGVLLVVWAVTTLRAEQTPALAWKALAVVVPLSLLVSYHRAYDARLLLLCVPACAMLWSRRGTIAKVALTVTSLAFLFTAETLLAFFNPLLMAMHLRAGSLMGRVQMVLLARLAPLSLLAMCLFYLWIFVRDQLPAAHWQMATVTGEQAASVERS